MKRKKRIIGAIAGCAVSVLSYGKAFAEPVYIDLESITIDTTAVAQMAITVLTALAMMWGLRKLIKSINRS